MIAPQELPTGNIILERQETHVGEVLVTQPYRGDLLHGTVLGTLASHGGL